MRNDATFCHSSERTRTTTRGCNRKHAIITAALCQLSLHWNEFCKKINSSVMCGDVSIMGSRKWLTNTCPLTLWEVNSRDYSHNCYYRRRVGLQSACQQSKCCSLMLVKILTNALLLYIWQTMCGSVSCQQHEALWAEQRSQPSDCHRASEVGTSGPHSAVPPAASAWGIL